MDKILKGLVICGVFAIGAAGILLMVKAARHGHHAGIGEKTGRGIDEGLRESKAALDKATAHVQSVFEHIKSPKA